MTYPMNVFDQEAILEDDTDLLIRMAFLAEAGLSLEEIRAYESQRASCGGREPS